MQIIQSYSDFKPSNLHRLRLYYRLHPLLQYRRNYQNCPVWIDIESFSQSDNVCFIDSAGWIFPLDSIIVESNVLSKKWCRAAKIFNYMDKSIDHPKIISYCPELLRYASLEMFVRFLDMWVQKDMLLYFDKRLVIHNYLKFDLKSIVNLNLNITEYKVNTDLVRWHIQR